jgi:dihydrofolate reductase
MSIALIVAASENGVIGVKGGLPWHLPGDMRFFKQMTMGHPVIMGRVTWESIPPKFRPLAGRRNIVITREEGFVAEGAEVVPSIEAALEAVGDTDAFIIGGASVYAEFMRRGLVDLLFLTRVRTELEGDAFFRFEEEGWRLIEKREFSANESNPFSYAFCLYAKLPITGKLTFLALPFQREIRNFK